ncbi:MAG: GNAT family N-acetyltransferase [Flavobacteriales bacterium]|nr:GNAT family N-acetyltransferase [Flavobacteriales bacterium]
MSKYNVIIETKRFELRELVLEDSQMFYALNLDPEVTRYTGDRAFQSIGQAWHFLEEYIETVYPRDGFGRWAILDKKTGAKWGWAGLKKRENGEIDLGYRLFQEYWGKGCAGEVGEGCLRHAFVNLKLESLIAEAVSENIASIRVMEKLGFKYLRDGVDHGFETKIYSISQPEYLKR